MLPLVTKLTDKRVLVIGAGRVAAAKIALCLEQGAIVDVVARDVLVDLPAGVTVTRRDFEVADLGGAHLVIAATGDPACNDTVWRETRRTGQWLNVVDNPALCDVYFTANHRVGDIVIAVSSQGTAPALAQYVRDEVAAALPEGLDDLAATIRRQRDEIHRQGLSSEDIDWRRRIAQWRATREGSARA